VKCDLGVLFCLVQFSENQLQHAVRSVLVRDEGQRVRTHTPKHERASEREREGGKSERVRGERGEGERGREREGEKLERASIRNARGLLTKLTHYELN
jgi:hypothetical protein